MTMTSKKHEVVDLSSLTSLAENLDEERSGYDAARSLCEKSQRLLKHCGVRSSVNSFPAVVSPYYQEVTVNDKTFYARLAGYINDEQQPLPIVVFDSTKDVKTVTPDAHALVFKEFGNEVSLVVKNDLNPLLNPLEYIKFVEQLIDYTEHEYMEGMGAKEEASARRRAIPRRVIAALRSYFSDESTDEFIDSTTGQRRRFVALGSSALLLVAYCHLPFRDNDAKVGIFPMPQPIELLVDWNNAPDHRAQAFKEPTDAQSITVGQKSEIKIIDSYDTEGAPSGISQNPWTGGVGIDSRSGLYRFRSSDTSTYPEKMLDSNGCFAVSGNFQKDRARIFTQDVATAEHATYSVESVNKLNVCVKKGAPKNPQVDFFVWSK